jgi:hypothetical protein
MTNFFSNRIMSLLVVVTVVYGGQYHFRYKDSDLKKRIFKLQNVRSEFVTIIILADIVVNVADVILPVFLDFPEVDSESQSVLVTQAAMILL